MKKMLYLLIFITVIFILAQTDYEKWKEQQNKTYSSYISKQDKDFSEFLKKNWEEFKAFKENKLFTTPKIKKVPIYKKESKKSTKEQINRHLGEKENTIKIEVPKKPEAPKITNEMEEFKPIKNQERFLFWGFPVTISKVKIEIKTPDNLTQKYIADFWYKASVCRYKNALNDLKKFKDKINLNDWGYCLLINAYSKKIFPQNHNNQNLFDWFLLLKSGYDIKIGYNNDRVVLLMPSKETIYGYPYIKQNDKNYYLVDFDNKKTKAISVYTYNGKYPDANNIIDFNMKKNPKLKAIIIKKELKFKYNGKKYIIPVEFDKNISEFLKRFPNTDLSVYFNSELGPIAKYSIVKAFKPILEGKTQEEAINILLRFMQTAFAYKTDQEQFGYEKVFYPEETLFYPYSDCEDRAILFSYLVRTLLGLQVVGLDYPGHVATAVNLSDYAIGDKITFDGKNYIVCDPTYINAPLGNAMPKFKNKKPKIIKIAQNRR